MKDVRHAPPGPVPLPHKDGANPYRNGGTASMLVEGERLANARLRLGTGQNGFPAIFVRPTPSRALASGVGREDCPRRLMGLPSLVTGQKRTRSAGMITATIRGLPPRRARYAEGLGAGTFNPAAGRRRTTCLAS
jgi:hypothetical protein